MRERHNVSQRKRWVSLKGHIAPHAGSSFGVTAALPGVTAGLLTLEPTNFSGVAEELGVHQLGVHQASV